MSARVLVVDDQAGLRSVLKAYLETVHGCAVTEAGDGLQAAGLLAVGEYDLVVTDLVMPVMTGLELLGFMKKVPRLSRVPVLMLTSQEEEADRRKAAALGVSDYLVKPFSPGALRPVIERFIPAQ